MENTSVIPSNTTISHNNGNTSATMESYTVTTPQNPMIQLIFDIRFWFQPVVISVGLVGNLLTLLVVSRKQNRSLSCSVYMGALAVADIFTLLGQGSIWMLGDILPRKMALQRLSILCTVSAYTLFSAAFGGVMIIIALLVERVVVVTWPLKAATLLSPKRAFVAVIIISVVTLAYNVPIIFTASMADFFGQQSCISVLSTRASAVYHITKVLLSGVLPFVAILTMNLTILCAVKSASKKGPAAVAKSQSNDKSSHVTGAVSSVDGTVDVQVKQVQKKSKRERQLTLMCVVVSVCFLCLTMPKYAHQLAFINIDWQRSDNMLITFGWSGIWTQNLYILNSAINFFLYCMTGSKFRADLRNMFSRKTSTG